MSAGLPPVANGGVLERLLRANEEQARAAGALVEIQRDNNTRLAAIEDESRQQTHVLTKLVEQMEKMEEARDHAVAIVKEHTTAAVNAAFQGTSAEVQRQFLKSESWWRRAAYIAAVLLVLSQLVGVGLEKLLAVFK